MAFNIRVQTKQPDDVVDAPARKRTRKADRPLQPPDVSLELRPSRYGLADKLMAHFQRVRNDREYAKHYGAFFRREMRRKFKQAEDLEVWLEKKRAEEAAEPPTEKFMRVRASELHGCTRMQAMRLMGFTLADVGLDDPHWGVSAYAGEQLHLMVEIAMRYLGLVKRSEFNVKTVANDLGGRVDAELDGKAFGEHTPDAIMDIKTIGTDDYKEGTWSKKVPGYIEQVTAYAELTGNTVGVVLLVDRGTGRMSDFEWTVDRNQAEELFDKAASTVKHARTKKLPPAEHFKNGKPTFTCLNFCPVARLCFQQERDGSIQKRLNKGEDPQGM